MSQDAEPVDLLQCLEDSIAAVWHERKAKEPCGGNVILKPDGSVDRYQACEVHLFSPGTCPWQKRTNEQRT